MLETPRLVVLTVTLCDGDAIVDVVEPHILVGHIPDEASATSAREGLALLAELVGPDLDAGAFRGIVHVHVLDENILDVVHSFWVLPEAADGYSMCAVAPHMLNEDVGAVALYAHAVYSFC